MEIEESRLVHLLVDKNDMTAANEVLSSLPKNEVFALVNLLLNKLRPYSVRLFLVQYLLINHLDDLPASTIAILSTKELGLKMIQQLGSEYQLTYQPLVDHPALMVESLIMNEHIHQIALLFRDLPTLRDDRVLTHYAKKALMFPERRKMSTGAPPIPTSGVTRDSFGNMVWLLTGDADNDNAKRQAHRYVSAPSINLAKSLLDLLSDPRAAGDTCLAICDTLSTSLDPSGSDTNLHSINLIQQLLLYAKLQFLRSSHESGGVSLCDTILSHVELLQSLIISKCDLGGVSLSHFSDPQKARLLRDKLIAEDRMKLAIDVSTKCGIESEPAWAAWGMALLEMGRYNDAKEKLKYCLVMPHEQSRGSAGPGAVSDNATLLQRIVKVLESGTALESRDLRALHAQLLTSPPSTKSSKFMELFGNTTPKKEPLLRNDEEANLDSVRFMQCVYYLRRYGTPRMLISFWTRHGLLSDAVSYILTNELPSSVFIEEVVMHCISHGKINQLKQAIRTTDPGLTGAMDHLLALCKYLNGLGAYTVLLDIQLFMGDFVRAGLTCIKLFHETSDVSGKVRHLEEAKAHFQEALAHFHNPRGGEKGAPAMKAGESGFTQNDISRYINDANLQIEATKYLQALMSKRGAPPGVASCLGLSLFAAQKQKAELAEQLCALFNFELAFRIMQEYRLPPTPIYVNAMTRIAQQRQTAKVLDLLKAIKGMINDSEWDEVVMAAIRVFGEQHKDFKTAESLVAKLVSVQNKVTGYILSNKLKSAYLLAVKAADIALVEQILQEAKRVNDKGVYDLCAKYLASVAGFT
eukprot:TRINITY_DN9571_c0_g1_i1.p1 TRINITY_DN9571_c0_g1~~TRINITY_DN9571_c0_g1_i1.p1  ORF type:complete len:900 (+),score=149.53 TRINITY_DN9571_c0_g1_i1:278-2701(+)